MQLLKLSTICIILLTIPFLEGCASHAVLNIAQEGTQGIIKNIISLVIGGCIIWYCWVEAKQKKRDPRKWAVLSFFIGFIALVVLVYSKNLPAQEETPAEEREIRDIVCSNCGENMSDADDYCLNCFEVPKQRT